MHISGIKKHTLESAHKGKESKEFENNYLFIYLKKSFKYSLTPSAGK